MRQWLACVWMVGSAVAGLAAGCASQSNPAYSLDGGSDSSRSTADSGGGDSTVCGATGQACCASEACDDGLTCSGGACVVGGDGGGGDGASQGDDGGGKKEDSGGGEDSGERDAGHQDAKGEDGGGEDGGTADCGSTPKLYPDEAGTIYCNYGDAGSLYCRAGNECCLGGYLGSGDYAGNACEQFGKACPNGESEDAGGSPGLPVECAQISDCTANGVKAVACCLVGATAPADDGCSYPRATDGTGIQCQKGSGSAPAKCPSGDTNICSSQADCPAGTTCTAGKWKILDLGFCL